MEQFIRDQGGTILIRCCSTDGGFLRAVLEDPLTRPGARNRTLNKARPSSGRNIPMCGVPVHADGMIYLQKLDLSWGFPVRMRATESPPKPRNAVPNRCGGAT